MPKKKKEVAEVVTEAADAQEEKKESSPKETVNLVKMYRDGKEADVHPYEVGNYEVGGWGKHKPEGD